MQEATQATAEGSKERARELYRTAAKTYPTSKEPWLKLAEDYFDAANYGQAILAAQEVLQRDPDDRVAVGVLAVSGLRVSSSALAILRKQQTVLNGGARNEAEDLARMLREVLGEPVLVPPPVNTAAPSPAPVRKRAAVAPKPAATAVTKPAAASVVPAAVAPAAVAPPAAAPAPAAKPPVAAAAPKADAPAADPFNVLKK